MIKCLTLLNCSLFRKHSNFLQLLNSNNKLRQYNCKIQFNIKFLFSQIKQKQVQQHDQKRLSFKQYLQESIKQFPYIKTPVFNQTVAKRHELTQQEQEKMASFNCLYVSQHRKEYLKQIGQLLIKSQFNPNQIWTGQKLFNQFYQKKMHQMIEQINEKKIDSKRKIYYFQVLANLQTTSSIRNLLQKLKEQDILKQNLHIQSLYAKALLNNQLSYLHIVDNLYQNLSQQTQKNKQQRILAAKTLLSIKDYIQVLPQKLKYLALQIITLNISQFTQFDHYVLIRHIYLDFSEPCKKYIEKLTDTIMKQFHAGRGNQIHVPLVLKTMKYRSKLHLDNSMFTQLINSFPQKFHSVFRSDLLNKQVFLSVATKQSGQSLNVDIRAQFGSYISKIFQQYQKKDQIDENELIRNLKLVLKYGKELSKEEIFKLNKILVNELYERTKQVASQQLKYYIFLTVYNLNYSDQLKQNESFNELIRQITSKLDKKCTQEPNTQNIQKMLNVQYQLCRKQANSASNIFRYNYENVQISPRLYSYLFYLMKKLKYPNSQKYNVISQVKKDIYINLNQGKFSLKVIYTIIDVLDQLNFQDKYIYIDIQRAITYKMQKSLQKGGQTKQIPFPKDIIFLKEKLMRKDKCSKKFRDFLIKSQTQYDFIEDHIRELVQSSKNWQIMKQKQKDNRKKSYRDEEKNQKNENGALRYENKSYRNDNTTYRNQNRNSEYKDKSYRKNQNKTYRNENATSKQENRSYKNDKFKENIKRNQN